MVLNLDTVTQDIENWIVNFVEVPHPALGGWPPCPYARSARMKKTYDVRIGVDPYFDLKNQARWGMGDTNFKAMTIWALVYVIVCAAIAAVAYYMPRETEADETEQDAERGA